MTAAAAALLAAGMICGCSNPQKAGVKALEEGNYEEAQVQFEKLTEEDGRDAAEGWRGLGMARYETEDYQGRWTPSDRPWKTGSARPPRCII